MYLLNGICYDDQNPPKMHEIPWLIDLSWLQGAHLFETVICYQVSASSSTSTSTSSSTSSSTAICFFRLSAHVNRLMIGAQRLGFHLNINDVYADFEIIMQRHIHQIYPLQDRSIIRYVITDQQRCLFIKPPVRSINAYRNLSQITPKNVEICHFPLSQDLPRWLKHGSRGEWIARKRQAQVDELIFIDDQGFILEGDSSAVFIISQNVIYLPPPSSQMLSSITRSACIDLLNLSQIPYMIQAIHSSASFECAFLAGTIKELVPIGKWGNRSLDPNHPLFLKLLALWQIYTQQADFCQ